MKFTDSLNSEHDVFLVQLGALERLLDGGAPQDEVRACALVLAEAVERHRQGEEDLLYPAILREFGQDFPPIRVMEMEHEQIERCLGGLRDRAGNGPELTRDFIDVLRQHIHKEVHVLFPMAETRIGAAELEKMNLTHRAARPTGG
jgi:hemerythrin-like domain-containing protein